MASSVTVTAGSGPQTSDGFCPCCACVNCRGVDCPGCPNGTAPDKIRVLWGSVEGTPICSFQGAPPFNVYHLTADLSGKTFTAVQTEENPCVYTVALSVGDLSLKRCTGDGTGCAACSGGTEVITAITMIVTIGGGPFPTVEFAVETSDLDIGDYTVQCLVDHFEASGENPCCGVTTVYLAASTGLEDAIATLVNGSYSTMPCDGA